VAGRDDAVLNEVVAGALHCRVEAGEGKLYMAVPWDYH
jgi:hypothetical protein